MPSSVIAPDLRHAALRVPVFHKIWFAGAGAVVLAAALTALVLTGRSLPTAAHSASAAAIAALGSLIVYGVVIRLALTPLGLLARAAERVAQGDLSARAAVSALSDSEMRRIAEVFNRALDRAADERQRLRDLAARAREMHEAERLRTAQRLHESTAQTLATMLIRLQVARRAGDPARRDAALDALRADVAEAAQAVQRVAFELRPPAISELGVGVAVESFAREACAAAGLELSCDLDGLAGELAAATDTALYRILQEAIENATRHARARTLWIGMRLREDVVEASVRDDGRGFPVPAVLDAARCLGLFEMEQRAERLGGCVTVTSAPGCGTEVLVRIPRPVRASIAAEREAAD